MDELARSQGFYSILRYRRDATRDEARNVAVILVEPEGLFGGMRAAAISTISSRLAEQGLLDSVISSLESQFEEHPKPGLPLLHHLHDTLQRSVYVTEPRPVAVADPQLTLEALYKAYVAPRATPRTPLTKGRILDKVVRTLRRGGLQVQRGAYVRDFVFDVVVQQHDTPKVVLEVLSFAVPRRDWVPIEHDAGYFLHALAKVDTQGQAVVQPPLDSSGVHAVQSHHRVMAWFQEAKVPTVHPDEIGTHQKALPL